MKNTIKIMGLLLFIAIIGFMFAACEEESTGDVLNGTTWRGSYTYQGATVTNILTFNSPNLTMTTTVGTQTQSFSGTYSISGSTVTITMDGQSGSGTISGNTLVLGNVTYTKQ